MDVCVYCICFILYIITIIMLIIKGEIISNLLYNAVLYIYLPRRRRGGCGQASRHCSAAWWITSEDSARLCKWHSSSHSNLP